MTDDLNTPRPTNPWDQLPQETPEMWAAFRLYLHSPPPRRSVISGIAESLKVPGSRVYNWLRDRRWRQRAAAFDRAAEAKSVEAAFSEAERIGKEHMRILAHGREVVARNLERLCREAQAGEGPGSRVHVRDAITLLDRVVTLERLILGEATSRVDVETTQDLSKLSDDELEALRALVEKVEATSGEGSK
jgi:hypothetical protein